MSSEAVASEHRHIPLTDLHTQHAMIETELRQAIDAVLAHGRFIGGPEIARFEERFAAYCGTKHCVGVSSGTDALTLGLIAVGIGRGDEVIVPSLTFFATAESVVSAGATPVLADVGLSDGLMTADLAARAITDRTAAIVPVHLYGQTVDLTAFRELTARTGLLLAEDAAQAHGALWRGDVAGSAGAFGAFSFYPGKNLGALGDAGAMTTSDDTTARTARLLRDHGRATKYEHRIFGVNARMDTIQAAGLLTKLPWLDGWNDARREHARAYSTAFADVPGLTSLSVSPDAEAVFHQYVVRVPCRADLVDALADAGIATGVHYPIPLHKQPPLAGSASAGDFPNAEQLAAEVLSLPVYPELTAEQRQRVIDATIEFVVAQG